MVQGGPWAYFIDGVGEYLVHSFNAAEEFLKPNSSRLLENDSHPTRFKLRSLPSSTVAFKFLGKAVHPLFGRPIASLLQGASLGAEQLHLLRRSPASFLFPSTFGRPLHNSSLDLQSNTSPVMNGAECMFGHGQTQAPFGFQANGAPVPWAEVCRHPNLSLGGTNKAVQQRTRDLRLPFVFVFSSSY